MKAATFVLLLIVVASHSLVAQSRPSQSCAVSPVVRDVPPSDPNADTVGPSNWYLNGDRTLWAGPVPDSGWPSGGTLFSGGAVVKGQKTYWVRPQGTQLVISGRRLDGDAPPVEAQVPCCYRNGYQIVGLFFPTPGCWEITAKAGDGELQFVTEVNR
jgi:hypothetical protein